MTAVATEVPRRLRAATLKTASTDELFVRFAEDRDPRIRDELVDRHRWLARVCAWQMRRRSEPFDELEQVALIGIFKAVERFDPSLGVPFRTYASITAGGELRRHYRDRGWMLRVPRSLKDTYVQVQRAVDELTSTLGHAPTAAETADWLGMSVETVLEALEAGDSMRPHPLVGPPPMRRGSGQDDPAMEASLGVVDDREAVRRLMSNLEPRKMRVVALRFFAHMTQQEIADAVGVSQVQVSRLLRAALTQMRAEAGGSDLAMYAEAD